MTRKQLEAVLSKMGFRVSNKGFLYLADTVELIHESGDEPVKMMYVYYAIAKKRNDTPTRVERCLRYTIENYYSEVKDIPDFLLPPATAMKLYNKEFVHQLANYLYSTEEYDMSNVIIETLQKMISDSGDKNLCDRVNKAIEIIKR